MKQSTLDELDSLMVNPGDEDNKYKRMLIYGDFGLGKSTWAAQSGLKTLFIDTSKGFIVLKDFENVRVIKYVGLSQIDAIVEAVMSKQPGWDYEVIVVDEISTVYQIDLERVTAANTKTQGDIREEAIPQQRDYLASQNRILRTFRPLMDLDVHVILLCHERRTKDEATNLSTTESDLAPRLSKEINRSLHLIGRLYINKQGDRELLCNPARLVQAKNRLGLKNNPTLQEIIEVI